MKDKRVVAGVIAGVIAVWLVGAAVTRYSVEQMAYFAPIAICVVGATVAVVMLWVKVILQVRRERKAGPAGRPN
jgi:uncharacterized membrane protein YeaQ/YmgE (transglycosylase-associated protein family)